jgi:tetratricopeptide (TPR) repeat protein
VTDSETASISNQPGAPAPGDETAKAAPPATPTAQPDADGTAAAAVAAAQASGERVQRAAESEGLTEQGIHFCRTARWREAIEPLRRAIELDPTNAAAFYYLGDACNHADALAGALEAFEAASRLQPDHWRALKGIGIVLDRMRRPQEAAAAYQRAREAQHKTAPRQS